MAEEQLIGEFGPGGFATWQDARAAIVAVNAISLNRVPVLHIAQDVTINNNTLDWANANTDMDRICIVRPKPGLGWRDLYPEAQSRPPSGIKLTINAGANNGLLSSNGFIFEDFLVTATSTTAGRYPINLGSTGSVRGGMRRCWINGNNSVQPLLTMLRGSAVPAAFAEYFLQDSVIEALGSSSLAAAVFSYNACVERTLFSAPQLALRIAGGVGGPVIRNSIVLGDVLNEHTGNVQAVTIAASGNNKISGSYTRGGSGTSYNAGTFATGLTAAAFEAGGYRPAAGGILIDAADDSANFTLDMGLRNRSSIADIGPIQRTAGLALPTGSVSASLPSGQSVTVSWTQAGATSGTVTLDGDSDLVHQIDVGTPNGSHTFLGVPAGSFTVRLDLANSGGPLVVTGNTISISETGGSPTAPQPVEPEETPAVADVAGVATSAVTAQVSVTTNRSGGTLYVVVTQSEVKPTRAQLALGQSHTGAAALWADDQSPPSPGGRVFSAAGLSPGGPYYAHAYHEHPDGASNIASSSAWTQPALVIAPEVAVGPTDLTVDDGDDAVFTFTYTGTEPVAVQARRNGINETGAVASAGTVTFTVADADGSDSGAVFTFHLSNEAGGVTTDPVELTVNAPVQPPTITSEPSDDAVTEGESAVFGVEATNGGGVNAVQWFSRPQGDGSDGAPVAGATSTTLTTAPLTVADDGREYRPRIANEAGEIFGRWARVSVAALVIAPTITTEPQSQTRNVGQVAVFTVAATGTAPFDVDWFVNGALISGAHGLSMTTAALLAQDNGAEVYCVVKNAAGEDTSAVAVLTVLTPVVPPVMPGTVSFDHVTHLSYLATWAAASNNPTRYEISINGSGWESVGTSLSRLVEGRTPQSTDVVDVRAVNADGVSNVISASVVLLQQPAVLPPGTGTRLDGISPPALFQLLAMAGDS